MNKIVKISNIHAKTGVEKILKGVTLVLKPGEIHAIMGPNGSGKSTLAKVIIGHPLYKVTRGSVLYGRENILKKKPHERAKKGFFMAFQYPVEIPGVNMFSYLRAIYSEVHGKKKLKQKHAAKVTKRAEGFDSSVSVEEFQKVLEPILQKLDIEESFLERSLNEGFSGGEKKKAEILQCAVLNPKVIILDETDSGLDIDSLKTVAEAVQQFRAKDSIVLIITHYQRILKYIKPDKVHIMKQGKIVKSGTGSLAIELEKKGYSEI